MFHTDLRQMRTIDVSVNVKITGALPKPAVVQGYYYLRLLYHLPERFQQVP